MSSKLPQATMTLKQVLYECGFMVFGKYVRPLFWLCRNTWHTGSLIVYAYYIYYYYYGSRIWVPFLGKMRPALVSRLKTACNHLNPRTSSQCGDLSTRPAICLLIVQISTTRIVVIFNYQKSATVHPQIQVSNKRFFLPSLCSVSKFLNCIALYYGLYVEFLMKKANMKYSSGCVQILGTINITQMR
jgi:hypothetical protein